MISRNKFVLKKNGEPRNSCFCRSPELIENYDKAMADTEMMWVCHHRFETHDSEGNERLVEILPDELKPLGMYYDRPPEELIFMTQSEHKKLHCSFDTFRDKMSEKMKGNQNCKGKALSEERKRRLSNTMKGKHKGKHWEVKDGKRVWY